MSALANLYPGIAGLTQSYATPGAYPGDLSSMTAYGQQPQQMQTNQFGLPDTGFNPQTGAAGNGNWWSGQPGVAGDGVRGWLGNGQNLASVFQGIGALTQAYLGFKELAMAKDAFKLQKEAYRTNMRNSTQTYNTSLEDRIRGRTSDYEGKENDVNSYLNKNRLSPNAG